MNIEEIRKAAPSGATHYRKFKRYFRYYFFDDDYKKFHIFTKRLTLMPSLALKVKPLY